MEDVLDHQEAAQVYSVGDVEAIVRPPTEKQPCNREECPKK